MADHPSSSLTIKSLSIAHLARFSSLADPGQLPHFQAVLLGDWLARFEQRFPDLLPSRSPRCLVALNGDRPVAAVVVRPFNRRGSCWILQWPEFLELPAHLSGRSVQRALLQQALQLGSPHVRSWVVRCPSADADRIALMRELGFQPLRPMQTWTPPTAEYSADCSASAPPEGLQWQPVSRRTAQLLWPLEQGGSFSHLRQITDRHWLDLLDRGGPGCGVLMANNAVLAGCLQLNEGARSNQLELLRDLAWDPRLETALPWLLERIRREAKPSALISAMDDAPLGQVMQDQGWLRSEEQLLMGRSMWRRQSAPRQLQITRPLDQVLGRLRPGQTPFPTPSLGRR